MAGTRSNFACVFVLVGAFGCGATVPEDEGQDEAGETDPGPPCSIPDPAFAARARSQLGIAEGEPISTTAAASLTDLALDNAGITDLEGLQCFTELKSLTADDNMIADASPLAGLQELIVAFLDDNLITSTSGIQDLPRLEVLVLSGNPIVELSGLDGLDVLEIIELDHTPIVDLSGLASVPSLYGLSACSTPLTELSTLPSLPGLTYVSICQGQLAALELEASLPALLSLELEDNALTAFDATPEQLPALRLLGLDRNPLLGLDSLADFDALVDLRINEVGVADLSPLADLEQLERIEAAGNGISDPSPVARAHYSDLSDNAIDDLSALFPHSPAIVALDVSDNLILDPDKILGLELEPCTDLGIAANPVPDTVEDHFCGLGVVVDSDCNHVECFGGEEGGEDG